MLAPTRELALQVCRGVRAVRRPPARLHVLPIYGGQGYGVQLSALRRGVHVVVGTPGRIMDHLEKGTLDLSELRFLVLDEADEMLNMGFAEDVETILADTPDDKQVALFSATMPAQIRRISKKYLHDPVEITVKIEDRRRPPTSRQRYLHGRRYPQKLDALTRILEVENFEGMIVFVRTKNATEELAERLRARGLLAPRPSTATSSQAQRERTIDQLREGKLDILVATDVAARGLDVERISHVVNYDIPTDTESYVHRIGRTGRAGRSGEAISFVTPRERLPAARPSRRPPGSRSTQMQLPTRRGRQRHPGRQVRRRDHRGARGSDQVEFFRDADRRTTSRSTTCPAADIAAALAVLAQDDEPLLLEPEPSRRRPTGRATRRPAREARRDATTGRRGPRAGAPTCRWRRTGSRSASGTRSSRARSSARSPTRAA